MKRCKVLLVDDVLFNRRILKAALSVIKEVDFLEASDSFAAISIFEKNKIDLIILDLIMPGKSGHEVMEELRTIAGRNIPIIVYSAISDKAVIKEMRDKGVFEYLIKPLNSEHLRYLLPERVIAALKSRDCKLSEGSQEYGRLAEEQAEAKKVIINKISELEHTRKQLKDMNKDELYELLYELLADKRQQEYNNLSKLKG